VASCIVFDTNGPVKSDYRRFNIEDITPGDDYAAIKQALERRYKKIKEGEALLPDILFVDGGKGQVTQAKSVLQALQIPGVLIIGVAKGPDRKAGLETLIISRLDTGEEQIVNLSSDSPALHLIQNIRDEAHRFAITGHRQRRAKARSKSVLEEIEGLGAKRRQQLLKQFGGLQEVVRAGVEDIARIKGISKQLAQRIYDALH
jgi:excinuclease ABC subunit C